MKYKKGLVFICLIICLFSIASVCASDVNETVVANEDQSDEVISVENEKIISINNDDIVSIENSEKINSSEWDKLNYNVANDENDNQLGGVYKNDDVEIMIANNADYDSYCIRMFIYNNLTGDINVYVDNSLKWTKQLSSSDYNDNMYWKYLYPKNLGMDYSTSYKVKVTVNDYSYQVDTETGGGMDGFAGIYGVPVSKLKMYIE